MKLLRTTIVLAVSTMLAFGAYAAETLRSAEIIDIIGHAEITTLRGERQSAEVGMVLTQGDLIETGSDSWMLLDLKGIESSSVELEENTKVLLSELLMDQERGVQKTMLDVAIGRILITAEKIQREDSNFRVKTPTSVVGVRGTTFAVEVEGIE